MGFDTIPFFVQQDTSGLNVIAFQLTLLLHIQCADGSVLMGTVIQQLLKQQ